jgi:Zn-dependent peptidase ImmA (M78 family)
MRNDKHLEMDPSLRCAIHEAWHLNNRRVLNWDDLVEIAHLLGVVRVTKCPMISDAAIIGEPGTAIEIAVKSDSPAVRQCFSLAHEIGHLLLARSAGTNATPLMARRQDWRYAELAANRVGAELLVPSCRLRSDLLARWKLGIGDGEKAGYWDVCNELARTYNVSRLMMARRVLEITTVNGILLLLGPTADKTTLLISTGMQLQSPIDKERDRLLHERQTTTSGHHYVDLVRKDNRKIHIRVACTGRPVGTVSTYAIIGWVLVSKHGSQHEFFSNSTGQDHLWQRPAIDRNGLI